jgi:hypothetical protein
MIRSGDSILFILFFVIVAWLIIHWQVIIMLWLMWFVWKKWVRNIVISYIVGKYYKVKQHLDKKKNQNQTKNVNL